jgi:asparagine synthase (glutamine-hydrolysing)
MCGIAGIVRFDDQPIDRLRAEAMLKHMLHRGPDGHGISEHPRCTLAHARLAIIDALGGDQPMHTPRNPRHDQSGPLHLVFNGEVYNHRELRTKLVKRGFVFRSDHSDTEALLLGYRAFGKELPKHLRGMFAFAIWDENNRELYLARDRTGKKPLYFRKNGGELTFASLPATLAADPACRPEVDQAALVTYLRVGYPFGSSMIRGISEVPPAHWMTVDACGATQAERYWKPPPISHTSTPIGAVDSVSEVLTEAVGVRLEADVPLGCFLSGGIDSSLIAAIAQKELARQGGGKLRTFSVAMPDSQYDESPHARAVAEHIGSEHTELMADASDTIADLQRLMRVAGEPTADSGILPSYWLCQTAKPHVSVALSGDGGDELFGGYDRYRAMSLLARHRWWLRWAPTGLLRSSNERSTMTRLRRLADAASGTTPADRYASMIHLFTDDQLRTLVPGLAEALGRDHMAGWPDESDAAHAAMRWDLGHYLPFDLLRKVDRSSMAVALEVRCPMLDTQVADLAGHLPTSVLMPGGVNKGLLRKLAARHLPDTIIQRPKRGFAIPIGRWFREKLRDDLADHLNGTVLASLGIDPKPVKRLFDEHTQAKADHTHRLFALLQLSLWGCWLKDTGAESAL